MSKHISTNDISLVELDELRTNMSDIINVRQPPYNLKGDGTDETEAILELFELANTNGSVRLYFPEGNYSSESSVRVYKNTVVMLHEKATIKRIGGRLKGLFVNGELDNFSYATGYNGEGNIHFIGGTIDLNSQNTVGLSSTSGLSAFDFAHGENITFHNLNVKNGQNGHYFQISSCKDVVFDNCHFSNQYWTDTSKEDFEVIQLEEARDISFPAFGSYDGTITKDVTIKNCTFDNVVRAIGNHSYPAIGGGNDAPLRYVENITVENCTIRNVSDKAFHLEAFKNFTIYNNVIEDIGDYGIYQYYSHNCNIKENEIKRTQKSAYNFNYSNYNKFKDNHMTDVCLSTASVYSVIRGDQSNYNELYGSVIDKTGTSYSHGYPIYITDSTGNKIYEKNLPSGTGSNNGGKMYVGGGTSFIDTTFGQENIVLFDGDLGINTQVVTLSEDLRGFSTIIILGNDNSSATAGITSMVLPKVALLTGATTSRFRFIPDSVTGDRIDFSFPDYISVQADDVVGTSHIRKIVGIR